MAEERLQKVLAAAGVDSRRACEKLITQGRVQVNGQTVTELGTKVDPEKVLLSVDGKPVHKRKRHLYLKLNKPRDVLSDIGGDTRGRQSVADLLPPELSRVFPVGRLDLNSEGLILLTDDGALAHKLTHPSFRHEKIYYVLVDLDRRKGCSTNCAAASIFRTARPRRPASQSSTGRRLRCASRRGLARAAG